MSSDKNEPKDFIKSKLPFLMQPQNRITTKFGNTPKTDENKRAITNTSLRENLTYYIADLSIYARNFSLN